MGLHYWIHMNLAEIQSFRQIGKRLRHAREARGQSRRSRATGRRRARTLNRDVSLMMIRRDVPPLSRRLGCASLALALFPPWFSLLEGELADWRCAVGLPAPSTRNVCV